MPLPISRARLVGIGPEVCADVAFGGAIAGCGGASGTVSGACPAAVPQNNPKHSNTETVFRRSVCMPNPGAITVQVLPGFLSEGGILARNICLPRTKLTSLCSVFLFAAAGIHTKKYQVSANELLKSYSLIRKPPCRINSTAISVLKNFGSQEPKSFADTWYFFAERTIHEPTLRKSLLSR